MRKLLLFLLITLSINTSFSQRESALSLLGSQTDINEVFDTNGAWSKVDFISNTGETAIGSMISLNNLERSEATAYADNSELPEVGIIKGSRADISLEPMSEADIKRGMREMLVKNLTYAESQLKSAGYFGNGQNTEHGVRTNADYALVYAFIYKKAQDQSLPGGLSFATVKQHALDAIRYSYQTHKANQTLLCTNNAYWGLVWESALWTTSTAYAAWLMWDDMTNVDKVAVKKMVVAEANHKLSTPIPTAVNVDTKAEENGWDTNVLAIAAAMFPEEKNAEAWTYRCQQYAMNSYSVASDLYNFNVVDGKYVRDWYIGSNLLPDYALENHNFFHTSYLNIPIQELSESLLAYKAVQNQKSPAFPMPDALKHNVINVWNSMLKELILPDGILAMPNGNDWSMYLYDELATYSALACIYRDPDALMLESMVLQWAKIRQATTSDGAFMLNPDVGERRMGVTARRIVFAHLYHDYYPTNDLVPTRWRDFSKRHETTKHLSYSGIIRSNNDHRFTTFSWFQSIDGTSYKSYMGMVSPNSPNYSNIIFPSKVNNTGNFTGYIDVSGLVRNATLIANTSALYPKSYATTGKLSMTGGSLNKSLSFYSTPGNAVIYHEDNLAIQSGTLTKDGGLMLGITTDVLTNLTRTLYTGSGNTASNGEGLKTLSGNWVNIDNVLGMVVDGGNGIAFGEKELITSVQVSKLYGSYSTVGQAFAAGDVILSRSAILYSSVDATQTQALAAKAKYPAVASGWKSTIAEDLDGKRYLLMSNFRANASSDLTVSYAEGAPVFDRITRVNNGTATATFSNSPNTSMVNELYCYVKSPSNNCRAVQGENPYSCYVINDHDFEISVQVNIWNQGNYVTKQVMLASNTCQYFSIENEAIVSQSAIFPGSYRNISKGKIVTTKDHWPENLPFSIIDEIDSTSYKSLTLPTTSSPKNLDINLMGIYSTNKLNVKSSEGNGPSELLVQTSTDGTNYTTVATASLLNTTEWQTISFANTNAAYVRIAINSSFGAQNVGIAEVQLFGTPQ